MSQSLFGFVKISLQSVARDHNHFSSNLPWSNIWAICYPNLFYTSRLLLYVKNCFIFVLFYLFLLSIFWINISKRKACKCKWSLSCYSRMPEQCLIMHVFHFRCVVLFSQWVNFLYIPTDLTFYDGAVLNDGYYNDYLVLSPVCGLRCFHPLKPLHFGWDNCVKSSHTYPNRSVQNCPTMSGDSCIHLW